MGIEPTTSGLDLPFPSYLLPPIQNESSCKIFVVKCVCVKMSMKTELTFIWTVSQVNSFRQSRRQLGNGLLSFVSPSENIHWLSFNKTPSIQSSGRLKIFRPWNVLQGEFSDTYRWKAISVSLTSLYYLIIIIIIIIKLSRCCNREVLERSESGYLSSPCSKIPFF